MAGAKRSTYDVSDAMLNRFVEWSNTDEFRDRGVYYRADEIVKWMRKEGFSGPRPLFCMLRALHEERKAGSREGSPSWRWWLVERITDCIERQYEREREVADAARTLLRSMADEIESLAKGGE